MKPRTLARLALLAAGREAQLGEALRRHQAAMQQSAAQQALLEAYRARLAAGWQNGAVVAAAQARRAGQFSHASQAAGGQIQQAAQQAAQQFDATAARLGELMLQRRALAAIITEAAQAQTRAAERAAQRNTQWRPAARDAANPIQREGA